jgi:glycosyltransferase involved in cell wall biosynthesis
MIMGGVEKALISMLELMPKDEYDVTILVVENGGELINNIPCHVNVKCVYGNEVKTLKRIFDYIKNLMIFSAIRFGWYFIQARKAKTAFEQQILHSKMLPVLKSEFDLAIAFHIPASFPVIYVVKNLKAKKKIAWIHNDVSETEYRKTVPLYEKFYRCYDKIFCVSQNARNNFEEMFPSLKPITSVFYNILDEDKINLLSKEGEGYTDNFNCTRILTVGRYSYSKGQDIIPLVLSKLIDEGLKNIRWYCLGEGETRKNLEKLIKKYKLENHLFLLGNKSNPYTYIKDCDIYVQPSRHEGYCITIAEARALKKPIVSTNSVGAREQIENGKDGIIVEFDAEQLYQSIKTLVSNQKLCKKFEDNLKKKNVSTVLEMNKLKEILN